jgi:Na+-driven multidrug efflux pump
VRNGAQAAVLKVISLYGTAAVAALGIVYRLFVFALMLLVGLHMGAGTVAGQNLGAERLERALRLPDGGPVRVGPDAAVGVGGLGSAFSAAGFNLPFLVSKLGFQVPFLLLLRLAFRAPLNLVWATFLGTEIVELAVVWRYYRRGRWLKVRV